MTLWLSDASTRWRGIERFAVAIVFGLPAFVCVVAAVMVADRVYSAGSQSLQTAWQQSQYFFINRSNLFIILSATWIIILSGMFSSWIIHTREFKLKPLLVFLILLPQALPYEGITWITRTVSDDPTPMAIYCLLYRYFPLGFIFSYLSLSRFSRDVLVVSQSLGVTEAQLVWGRVLPAVLISGIAQFVFLMMIMAADHVGMSYSSGGQFTSIGNVIAGWSRTIDNREVAYTITLAIAIIGAVAAGTANVLGWWQSSIKSQRRNLYRRGGSIIVLPIWAFAIVLASAPLAVSLSHWHALKAKLGLLLDATSITGSATIVYAVVGTFLSAASALVVYLVVQRREARPPSSLLSICVAISMFGILIPPVMRGEFFLLPMTYFMGTAGNAAWAAFWMWISLFPAIAALAALHPASRLNRFQSLIESAGISPLRRLRMSIGHASPVLFGAALLWLFFAIFDTSVCRSTAGVSRPFGLWFQDQVSTTYDPGFIAAGVTVSYFLALALGGVMLLFAIWKRNYER